MHMMKKRSQSSDLIKKNLLLCTVLCLGITSTALAAASNFPDSAFSGGQTDAPPPLPPIPGLSGSTGTASPAAPAAPQAPLAAAPLAPGEKNTTPDDLKKLVAEKAVDAQSKPEEAKKDNFGKTPEKLADLPPPPAAPDSSDVAAKGNLTNTTPAPPAIPALATNDSLVPPPLFPVAPGGQTQAATEVPPVNVEPEKPKEKTWQTKLAPTSVNPQVSFNYRRNLLPATIYRTQYSEPNRHLPVAVSRQDYAAMLFTSVTRNDVELTRALLNSGVNVNVMSASGETPLAAARRAGAGATEQLLIARGGHY